MAMDVLAAASEEETRRTMASEGGNCGDEEDATCRSIG